MSNLIHWRKSRPVSWHRMIKGESNAIIHFDTSSGSQFHLLLYRPYNRWHRQILDRRRIEGGAICNAVGAEGG